jgi:nitrate reductase gamma subunit
VQTKNTEVNVRRAIDEIAAGVVILSIFGIVVVVLCHDYLDSLSPPGAWETAKTAIMNAGTILVASLVLAGGWLWIRALQVYVRTLSKRSFVLNTIFLLLLLGFSWLAGLIVYLKYRNREKSDDNGPTKS